MSESRRRIFALGALATATLIAGCTGAPSGTSSEPLVKDTIAVLFSYPWDSIAQECESTLGPAGYGYVQTSPPQEHITGYEWWTYYQPVSYELNSRMGSAEQFAGMVERCNAAGVEVIADAVVNHMTGQPQGGVGFAGSEFEWFNYPGLYDESDFNNYDGAGGPEVACDTDIARYHDRWEVQTCRLLSLADLATGKPEVQETIAGYLESLSAIGVAGYRIDAAKHIPAEELAAIWGLVDGNEDLYLVQEVIRGASEPITPEEYVGIGDVHEFSYGREIRGAFQGSQIGTLLGDGGIGLGESWHMLPSDSAGVFVDNHDTERNGETLNYKYGERYTLAQAFTLAWPYGMPSVHSGYEFSDVDAGPPQDSAGFVLGPDAAEGWTRTHAWDPIAHLVGLRNHVHGTDVNSQWTHEGNNAIAFGRGDRGFIALNNSDEAISVTLETQLPDGEYVNVYAATLSGDGTWDGPAITVVHGQFSAELEAMSAIALRSDVEVGAR